MIENGILKCDYCKRTYHECSSFEFDSDGNCCCGDCKPDRNSQYVDLLNREIYELQLAQKDKRIAELEKAFELACDYIKINCVKPVRLGKHILIPNDNFNFEDYFKTKAKEALKNE